MIRYNGVSSTQEERRIGLDSFLWGFTVMGLVIMGSDSNGVG